MSRPLLIASVALASYAALNLAIAFVVAAVWRWSDTNRIGMSPAARARQLVWLRACPSVGAAFITITVITPAFAIFEPERASEMAGPVVIVLAALALLQIGVSVLVALATLARTRAVAELADAYKEPELAKALLQLATLAAASAEETSPSAISASRAISSTEALPPRRALASLTCLSAFCR